MVRVMSTNNGSILFGDGMSTDDDIAQILKKLERIETDLTYIKEHMVDLDMILTPEEEIKHERSLKEYKKGKTYTLEDLERD